MQDSIVSKHLEEMEEFLKMSDSINILMDNLKDISTADINDLYELMYNKRKIEGWLSEDIANEDIKDSLQRLLQAINLIIDSLSESQIQAIENNKVKDIHKMNKAKYGNKGEYKGLKDVKDIQEKRQSIIQKYLVKSLVKFLAIGIIMLFITNGSMVQITNSIMNIVEGIVGAPHETSGQSVSEILDASNMQANTEAIEAFPNIVSGLMQVIVSFMLLFVSLRICMDLIYMMFPMFREIQMFRKYASEEALELVQLDNMSLGVTYEPKVVNYMNRVETAIALLHNLEDYVEKLNASTVTISDKNHAELFINNRDMLTAKLKDIKSRVNTDDTVKKLTALADAEILYRDINVAA